MHVPTLREIEETRNRIDPYVVETPVWSWRNREIQDVMGLETQVFLKLELFQHTGTFKPRGAVNNILGLNPEQRKKGVIAVSAGNHAIAVSYAASMAGIAAKVVMPEFANPARLDAVRAYGAEVVLVPGMMDLFPTMERIQAEEGQSFVHPFEGSATILGQATVGLEWCRQVPEMDAVIVPIGGGGLMAGIATAVKQMQPNCRVIGVEPEGADSMHRSFAAGSPQRMDKVSTIADSLSAPFAEPYSFALCHKFVDQLVLISDDQMREAMGRLWRGVKLAAEPAGAAATAALTGPLREELRGKRVGVIVCGTNIDAKSYVRLAIGD